MGVYVPDTEQVKLYFELGLGEYCGVENDATSLSENPKAFEDWLAYHDQALRERIARNIERDEYIYGDSPLLIEGKFVWGAAIRIAARIARGEA